VIAVPEDPPPPVTPETPADPDVDLGGGDISPADGTRLADTIVGRFADQARRTASAAKAGRVVNGADEPGVLDLTPLRELLSELVEELRMLRPRDRIARALRQAADIIDPQTPAH
jgi:thiamine monophosphate kinase